MYLLLGLGSALKQKSRGFPGLAHEAGRSSAGSGSTTWSRLRSSGVYRSSVGPQAVSKEL